MAAIGSELRRSPAPAVVELAAQLAARAPGQVAAVMYAEDAVAWFHRSRGSDAWVAENQTRAVRDWMDSNPIDTDWISSRLWHKGG